MSESEAAKRPRSSWLAQVDAAIFAGERATISVFLVAMTAMVFIDVVFRRLAAPDSRIGRLLASFTGAAPESAERAWIDANVAPIVGAIVGIGVLWAAFATAERNLGRRLLPWRGSALIMTALTAAVCVVFGVMVLSLSSRDVYLALYAVSVGLYLLQLWRGKDPGRAWKTAAIALVLTPLFLVVAFGYFPQAYTWAKELAMLMVLWVGFFGASICAREGRHIRLEALERVYPEQAKVWLRVAGYLVAAALCLFLAYLGYQYVFAPGTGTFSLGMELQETGLPDWVMTVSIPVAFALTAVRFVAAGVSTARGGSYGAQAKAEGMEEAEALSKRAEERDLAAGAALPASGVTAGASAGPTRPRRIVFWSVVAASVLAPVVLGKAGVLLSAILIAALLAEPIFVLLGMVTIACFALWSEDVTSPGDFSILVERIRSLADNKALLSVPFYVMSGAVMGYGQIGRRLVDFSNAIFGWLPGGLAISVVFGCILFSAISGSSPATVIAIGSVMGPALIANSYRKDFSVGLVTAAGSLGILIPPSIPMIVYCIVNTTTFISVEEFHAAGFAPGFVIGGVLAAYCIYRGIRDKTPRERFSLKRLWIATRDGVWSLLFPVLILGGIYLGFFDDIEAACTSVVYAVLIEVFVHRAFSLRDVPKVFMEVGTLLGSFLVILVLAMSFAEFLETQGIPALAASTIRSFDLEPWQFLLVVNLLLLLVGCVMDIMSAMFIFVPLLAPMALALGIDPIHFGLIFIVNLEIGYLLPPMGLNLYVSATMFRQPVTFVMRSVVPFILVMIVGLGIITYVPSITLDSAKWVMAIARQDHAPSTAPPPPAPEAPAPLDEDQSDEPDTPSGPPGMQTMEEMMREAERAAEQDAGPAP